MTNSRRLFAFGTLLIVAALGWASTLHAVTPSSLSRAVSSWPDMLDGEQRDEVVYSFRDEERFDLRLAPIRLEGLRREQMSEPQWQAWLAALGTTLSESGLEKVETIMSLEREVRQRDGEGWSPAILGGLGGAAKSAVPYQGGFAVGCTDGSLVTFRLENDQSTGMAIIGSQHPAGSWLQIHRLLHRQLAEDNRVRE